MSLRSRLLLGMVVVALVLVGAALVITRTTERHLVDQVDDQLRASRTPFDGRGPGPGGGPIVAGPDNYSAFYMAAIARDGTLRTLTVPNVSAETPPLPEIDTAAVLQRAGSKPFTVGSTGSLEYRALVREGPFGVVTFTAFPLGDVDAAVNRLVAVEAVATLAVLAVLGLVTSWVLRLGVRPVKQMTATATAIAAGDLSHRVPDVKPRTEAGELGGALNQMLGRIEEAFDERSRSEDRLRQFVADASHELRTPVATMRGYAELHRAGGLEDQAQLSDAMGRIEQESKRMGGLIDDMLLLARLDQGRPLEKAPVDLAVVVDDAAHDARVVAPERTISATRAVDGPVRVMGDDHRLRQVVANLVANALVHTPPEAAVALSLRVEGSRAVLEVTDNGQGMAPEAAARAFERFFRADPSRSRHRGGSGLGLAIVQASVVAHGGTVSLRSGVGQGTTVRVELPLAPVPPPATLPPPVAP